jgi:hypothetical protein
MRITLRSDSGFSTTMAALCELAGAAATGVTCPWPKERLELFKQWMDEGSAH